MLNTNKKFLTAVFCAAFLTACNNEPPAPKGIEGKYTFDDGNSSSTTLEFAKDGRLRFCNDGWRCESWVWEKMDSSRVKIERGSASFGPAYQVCNYIISGDQLNMSGCAFLSRVKLTRL